MKKLFPTLVLLMFAHLVFGQLRFSPKFGFNFSSLNQEVEDFVSDGRSSWNAGVDLRLEHGNVFFHPGIHLQKTRIDVEPMGMEEVVQTQVTSLKFPINGGFYLTRESSLLHLHLRGGIVPQFVTGAGAVEGTRFSKDLLNNFTWGTNVAVGVDFILLTVEFSYEFGLSNFYNDISGKNNMAALNFGFIF